MCPYISQSLWLWATCHYQHSKNIRLMCSKDSCLTTLRRKWQDSGSLLQLSCYCCIKTRRCVLVCNYGPYGSICKVQNHTPAHNTVICISYFVCIIYLLSFFLLVRCMQHLQQKDHTFVMWAAVRFLNLWRSEAFFVAMTLAEIIVTKTATSIQGLTSLYMQWTATVAACTRLLVAHFVKVISATHLGKTSYQWPKD